MPVFLNAKYPGTERRSGLNWPRALNLPERPNSDFLQIGLINNIGDAAMSETEDQFLTLLEAASGEMLVHVTLYTLSDVERKPFGQRRVGSFYWNVERIWEQPQEQRLDGLIVTGREPLTHDLRDESYWPSLQRVLTWTQEHACSAVWSCLAAHAAVLALDGIVRVRGQEKECGIFAFERDTAHALLAGAPATLRVPHSRWNGVSAEELTEKGYQVLTRNNGGAVDTFVKQDAGLFVFFQGHPEYESRTLLGEYRRDVGRYLRGDTETYPLLPRDYFEQETERSLREIESKATASRHEYHLSELAAVLDAVQIHNTWHNTAVLIYRNWLKHLWTQKRQFGKSWRVNLQPNAVTSLV